jgi:hypothetical protein
MTSKTTLSSILVLMMAILALPNGGRQATPSPVGLWAATPHSQEKNPGGHRRRATRGRRLRPERQLSRDPGGGQAHRPPRRRGRHRPADRSTPPEGGSAVTLLPYGQLSRASSSKTEASAGPGLR